MYIKLICTWKSGVLWQQISITWTSYVTSYETSYVTLYHLHCKGTFSGDSDLLFVVAFVGIYVTPILIGDRVATSADVTRIPAGILKSKLHMTVWADIVFTTRVQFGAWYGILVALLDVRVAFSYLKRKNMNKKGQQSQDACFILHLITHLYSRMIF